MFIDKARLPQPKRSGNLAQAYNVENRLSHLQSFKAGSKFKKSPQMETFKNSHKMETGNQFLWERTEN